MKELSALSSSVLQMPLTHNSLWSDFCLPPSSPLSWGPLRTSMLKNPVMLSVLIPLKHLVLLTTASSNKLTKNFLIWPPWHCTLRVSPLTYLITPSKFHLLLPPLFLGLSQAFSLFSFTSFSWMVLPTSLPLPVFLISVNHITPLAQARGLGIFLDVSSSLHPISFTDSTI